MGTFPPLACKTFLGNEHILFIYVSVISFTISCTGVAHKKYSLNNVRMSGPCSSFFILVYDLSQISFPKIVLYLCYY